MTASVERSSLNVLFPVLTGEATEETFTPTFTIYRSEGLGQLAVSTEALG